MAKVSLRLDQVLAQPNDRSGDALVKNRVLFQLVAPAKDNDNPASTFTFRGTDGKALVAAGIGKILDYGIVFKGEDFYQAFDEPLVLRIHFFQDIHDPVGKLIGHFIDLAVAGLLGSVKVLGVALSQVLDAQDGLGLGKSDYSQKLGFTELSFDPKKIASMTTLTPKLAAPDDVYYLKFAHPGDQTPERTQLIKKGAEAASVSATLRFEA